jgi:hypothetical protein
MAKKSPSVDSDDVDFMIDFLFGASLNEKLTPEERADTAHAFALNYSKLQGTSNAYATALADKVRAKALWIKGPTGRDWRARK